MSEVGDVSAYGSARDLPSFVEMKRQLAAFKGITLFFMRGKRAEVMALEVEMNKMADRVDAFYELLGPRNWVFNDWMNLDRVDAILDEADDPESAELKLIELFRDPEQAKWPHLGATTRPSRRTGRTTTPTRRRSRHRSANPSHAVQPARRHRRRPTQEPPSGEAEAKVPRVRKPTHA